MVTHYRKIFVYSSDAADGETPTMISVSDISTPFGGFAAIFYSSCEMGIIPIAWGNNRNAMVEAAVHMNQKQAQRRAERVANSFMEQGHGD